MHHQLSECKWKWFWFMSKRCLHFKYDICHRQTRHLPSCGFVFVGKNPGVFSDVIELFTYCSPVTFIERFRLCFSEAWLLTFSFSQSSHTLCMSNIFGNQFGKDFWLYFFPHLLFIFSHFPICLYYRQPVYSQVVVWEVSAYSGSYHVAFCVSQYDQISIMG